MPYFLLTWSSGLKYAVVNAPTEAEALRITVVSGVVEPGSPIECAIDPSPEHTLPVGLGLTSDGRTFNARVYVDD